MNCSAEYSERVEAMLMSLSENGVKRSILIYPCFSFHQNAIYTGSHPTNSTLTAVPLDAGASKEEKLAPDFVDRALWYNLAIPIRQLQSRSLELDLSNILWRVQLQVHRFRIWRPIAFSSNLLFFFSRQRSDCKRYTPDRITQPSILPFLMQNGNSTWMQEKLVQVCSSRFRSEILYQT